MIEDAGEYAIFDPPEKRIPPTPERNADESLPLVDDLSVVLLKRKGYSPRIKLDVEIVSPKIILPSNFNDPSSGALVLTVDKFVLFSRETDSCRWLRGSPPFGEKEEEEEEGQGVNDEGALGSRAVPKEIQPLLYEQHSLRLVGAQIAVTTADGSANWWFERAKKEQLPEDQEIFFDPLVAPISWGCFISKSLVFLIPISLWSELLAIYLLCLC